MPIYEFTCKACTHEFEVMESYADRERSHTCPTCGSTDVSQKISVVSTPAPSSF